MTRRDMFRRVLESAAGVALALTIDVDQLLWTPGARTFFLPVDTTFVTPAWITAEICRQFRARLDLSARFVRLW